MDPILFKETLMKQEIELNQVQMDQFDRYFHFLVQENEKLNLTAITEEKDVYLKHFYDSIIPAFFMPELLLANQTICDVGSGAGFPSIPLKIINPSLKVSIVDSLNKRVAFLNNLVNELNLTDIAIYHNRAEDFGNKRSEHRESFDFVTARAVARLNVLSELCLPLVKKGGKFIAMKASEAEIEIKEASYGVSKLGGQFMIDQKIELPEDAGDRHIIIYEKKRKTPHTYPRRAGLPNKSPLVEPVEKGGGN